MTETKTVIIAGAGPGLGLSVARRFGDAGYRVGLIARRPDALDTYLAELQARGISAEAATADLTDEGQVRAAFGTLRAELGEPDVLVFTALPDMFAARVRASELTPSMASEFFTSQTVAAITAVGQVIGAMRARGSGTILLTSGITALNPMPDYAPLGLSSSSIRNYALTLHQEMRESGRGVHVCHICIGFSIGGEAPGHQPDALSELYYTQATTPNTSELVLNV